jgi:signal transduction histidine kinase
MRLLESGRTRPLVAVGVLAVLLAAAEVFLDWVTRVDLNVSIIYGLPLILAAASRSQRLLWGLMAALVAVTFVVYFLQIPPGRFALDEPFFVNRVLSALALLLTAGLSQIWIRAVNTLDAANRELRRREELIARQNEELERRRRAAAEASSRKTRLLASISHDIRTPVNTISLLAAALRRAGDNSAAAVRLPDIALRLQANARSVAELVSDLIDLARIESGRLDLRETTFSLGDLLAGQCRDLLPLAQAKGLRLEAEGPEPPLWLHADQGKLGRILSNLISNAIKFTETGGVTVSADRSPDGAVLIQVRDTGIGVAADQRDHIFEEFAQLDNTNGDRDKGWGLGLAICRRLATAMGGAIGVESAPGQGSVFTVCLPARCVVEGATEISQRRLA